MSLLKHNCTHTQVKCTTIRSYFFLFLSKCFCERFTNKFIRIQSDKSPNLITKTCAFVLTRSSNPPSIVRWTLLTVRSAVGVVSLIHSEQALKRQRAPATTVSWSLWPLRMTMMTSYRPWSLLWAQTQPVKLRWILTVSYWHFHVRVFNSRLLSCFNFQRLIDTSRYQMILNTFINSLCHMHIATSHYCLCDKYQTWLMLA